MKRDIPMVAIEKPKKPTRVQRLNSKMKEQFPQITREMLWNRKRHNGFTTMPRTMPLVMKIVDVQSDRGHPAGHTLFCLWTRAMDHPYIVIDKPKIFATEAGLMGERAESSWRKRMAKLVNLGFILAKEGTSGPYHHVVLLNPHMAATRLNYQKLVQEKTWGFFRDRAEEVGALQEIKDTELEIQEEEGTAAKAKVKKAPAAKNPKPQTKK